MITHNDIKADLHTHTIASDHAFSTVLENMTNAKSAGMDYIAVTDHYYHNGTKIDRLNEVHRMISADRCSNRYMGITVINGGEFNVDSIDPFYHKDLLKGVKWRLLGLHDWFLENPISHYSLYNIFNMFINTCMSMNDWRVPPTAIAHIERGIRAASDFDENLFASHIEDLLTFTKDNNLYMEVNESSAKNKNLQDIMRIWIKIAKENGNKICLGSDAHFALHVGRFDNAIALLNEVDYPKELILNCDRTALNQFCK